MKKNTDLKTAIETLLFITDQPIGIQKICQAVGSRSRDKVAELVSEIQRDYEDRGGALQVLEIAEGFQMATRPPYAAYVRNLFKEKMTMRLSTAALETLSIVGYKQPLTRAEIEEIRGVEVIAALETLLEKALIRVVGRRETVGRPLLYGTTPEFLRHFGLRSIEDLPPIESYQAQEPAEQGTPVPAETAVVGAPQETRATASEGEAPASAQENDAASPEEGSAAWPSSEGAQGADSDAPEAGTEKPGEPG
ncbi:MAG: SMC-Scp complex subunit ScpB [Elusimicrobiota bacterium]